MTKKRLPSWMKKSGTKPHMAQWTTSIDIVVEYTCPDGMIAKAPAEYLVGDVSPLAESGYTKKISVARCPACGRSHVFIPSDEGAAWTIEGVTECTQSLP
ncbi:MAG: hypothetical protein WC322_06350 [Candidatus Paceibacterota bacterium]|jgi:hypothetical protein